MNFEKTEQIFARYIDLPEKDFYRATSYVFGRMQKLLAEKPNATIAEYFVILENRMEEHCGSALPSKIANRKSKIQS